MNESDFKKFEELSNEKVELTRKEIMHKLTSVVAHATVELTDMVASDSGKEDDTFFTMFLTLIGSRIIAEFARSLYEEEKEKEDDNKED